MVYGSKPLAVRSCGCHSPLARHVEIHELPGVVLHLARWSLWEARRGSGPAPRGPGRGWATQRSRPSRSPPLVLPHPSRSSRTRFPTPGRPPRDPRALRVPPAPRRRRHTSRAVLRKGRGGPAEAERRQREGGGASGGCCDVSGALGVTSLLLGVA